MHLQTYTVEHLTNAILAIQVVLEQIQAQNEEHVNRINDIAAEIRSESERQHNATMEQLRSTGQDLVSFNLTGVRGVAFSAQTFAELQPYLVFRGF